MMEEGLMKKIRVLMIKPMERPKVGYVPCNAKLLNKVFNYDDYTNNAEIMIMEKNVGILRNKNGAILDLKGNRKVSGEIIAGTFFVVGIDDNGFISSLSESDILKYTDRFRNIEIYTNRETLKSYWNKFEESLNLMEEEFV